MARVCVCVGVLLERGKLGGCYIRLEAVNYVTLSPHYTVIMAAFAMVHLPEMHSRRRRALNIVWDEVTQSVKKLCLKRLGRVGKCRRHRLLPLFISGLMPRTGNN